MSKKSLWRCVGKPRIFPTPDHLWDAACAYFQWVEDNPLEVDNLIAYQGQGTHEPTEKARPMTKEGFFIHSGCTRVSWTDYKKRDEYSKVIAAIEEVIYENKFSGASAGIFNSNIIAYDLGLRRKEEEQEQADRTININIVNPNADNDNSD